MAGTLVATTLSDGTNSTSTTNAIQGSAKAWVNFNGTNGVIRAQYNVSSVTRTGVGRWTVNFTNALPDTNYATSVNGNVGTTAATDTFIYTWNTNNFSLGTNYNGGAYDAGFVTCSIFR